ncbi:hypothetical protein [Burkholderia sp. FL-7-2-10-S1-D7]|uniref:hypothetical protein n=1 Tax=Burkholderia sp. FL-7-2-10-S1-D7 TaxID=1637866 RepID=UPI000A7762C4|nr:hypothetical protein [Burkholderia sp. FL-7-2-10-S1-D7]
MGIYAFRHSFCGGLEVMCLQFGYFFCKGGERNCKDAVKMAREVQKETPVSKMDCWQAESRLLAIT